MPGRLPHERALAGLTERATANRYLSEQVLPQHNKRVSGRATEPGPACIAWIGTSLAGGLGVQNERGVATDHTVRDRGTTLQIPQDPPRCAPERLDEKNPTEPEFPTPDNVTCYLQTA